MTSWMSMGDSVATGEFGYVRVGMTITAVNWR